MARELVLVPKIKYEHLLKSKDISEQREHSVQVGGEQVEKIDKTPTTSDHTIQGQSISDEEYLKTVSNGGNKNNSIVDIKNSDDNTDKPRLNVDKPLSKMHFERVKPTSSRSKRKKGLRDQKKSTDKERRHVIMD
ncbi:hypothetical protein MAR_028485 [Mya arenaria]|uniref:Uncharacterized protein n=1 Tax=Mya arenaria TaxID=6604 RepID=A0ABY7DLD4_MYAAR|nr:hypothetical protein MAR_028485 [Mya arenaria]